MSDSTLFPFIALDGETLAVQDWPLAEERKPRAMVLLVHGLGEHAGRYDHVARRLNAWGFVVRGYDQYGHGESSGLPGGLSSDNRLLDDLADVIDDTRAQMAPSMPLILLGHSMGGVVAARLVALGLQPVDGLVLSSPALDAGLKCWQKTLLALFWRIAPDLRVGNGFKPRLISHDPQMVAAYRGNPLIHHRISARLARFIVQAGMAVRAQASRWRVPTLLLYAGADKLVSPQGSRDFAAAAPAPWAQSQCFEDMYHEIFNEVEREQVFTRLKRWLDERF